MKRENATEAQTDRIAYRLHEVSRMTGLSVRSLRVQIALGRLVATRPAPKTTIILAEDLERFLADARARSGRGAR